MNIAVISNDRFQRIALGTAARRRGWSFIEIPSTGSFGRVHVDADAVIVDLERLDPSARTELEALASHIGPERVFVLAEEVVGVLPEPDALHIQGLQMKPFYPANLLRMIEASVPASAGTRRSQAAPAARSTSRVSWIN